MFLLVYFIISLLVPQRTYAEAAQLSSLDDVIASALSSIITLVGGIFIVMLVISGYHYLSAGSNKEAMTKAQQSLTMSLLGLVITVAAWTAVNLLGKFLGVNLGTFTICITPGC